jgi:hypothetical protein
VNPNLSFPGRHRHFATCGRIPGTLYLLSAGS